MTDQSRANKAYAAMHRLQIDYARDKQQSGAWTPWRATRHRVQHGRLLVALGASV